MYIEIKPNKIVFFDGDCLLCNRFVLFIAKYNRDKQIKATTLNGKTAKQIFLQINKNNFDSVVYYKNKKLYYKSDAVIEILYDINFYLKCFKVGYILPKIARDYLYDIVANNRHKIGSKENCCNLEIHLPNGFLLD